MRERFGLSHVVMGLMVAVATWLVCRYGPAPMAPRAIHLRYDSVQTFHRAYDTAADSVHAIAERQRSAFQDSLTVARNRPPVTIIRFRDALVHASEHVTDTLARRLLQVAEAEAALLESALAVEQQALRAERRLTDSLLRGDSLDIARLIGGQQTLREQRDGMASEARQNALRAAMWEARARRRVFVGACLGGGAGGQGMALALGVCVKAF